MTAINGAGTYLASLMSADGQTGTAFSLNAVPEVFTLRGTAPGQDVKLVFDSSAMRKEDAEPAHEAPAAERTEAPAEDVENGWIVAICYPLLTAESDALQTGSDAQTECGVPGGSAGRAAAATAAAVADPYGRTGTRAQVIAALWRLAGAPAVTGTARFADMRAGAYYTDAVIWAYSLGIIRGTGGSTVAPDAEITREQLAVMLYNYAKKLGRNFAGGYSALQAYDDADEISVWAEEAMRWCVANGILKGVGNGRLAPTKTATGAEIMLMLSRFFG